MSSFLLTRRFWPLFGATTFGAFADNTLRMATIVAVLAAFRESSTGAFYLPYGWGEHASSIVSMAMTLPIFLFSILSGQLADRWPRDRFIRQLKIIEVILMVIAAVFFALGSGALLIATMFLMGAQSAFFSPVRNAVMPQFYHKDELLKANGYYNAALFVAIVAGIGLGGFFVNQEGGRIIVSAMLIGAAGIGMLLAFAIPSAPAPGLAKIDWNLPAVAVRQYAYVWKLKGVFYPMLGIGWFWAIGAAVLANLPNYVADVFDGTDADISALQALFAIGAGIGSIIAGIAGSRMKNNLTLAGMGVAGTVLGCILVWALSQNETANALGLLSGAHTLLLLVLIGTAASNGFFAVPLMTALHRRAPEAERARIMGTSNMTNGAGATIGAAMVPPLREMGLGADDVFLVLGALQAGLVAFMYHRRRRIAFAAARMERAGT